MKYIKLVIASCLLLLTFSITAQQIEENMEDVVYLKNGSILRGMIIEMNNERVKIEILGGSVFAFQMTEVEKITREKTCMYIYQ